MNALNNFLSTAGYSDKQIEAGIEYAETVGYSDIDEQGRLALSRILYSDDQLAGGALVGWEPVNWIEWED